MTKDGEDLNIELKAHADAAPAQLPNDPRSEIERLSGLDAATYEGERKDAAARLGFRASVLDEQVKQARPSKAADDGGGQPAPVERLEPWSDPVDGASLAEEVRDRLRAHVVFGAAHDADATALWIIGTYLMQTWRLWPRLLITSPTKACGKSTLLEVIDAMAYRGLITSNASPAVIFRAIEAWRPTLLLDEADNWVRDNDEAASILNSGHTRRTARVLRVQEIEGEHVPVAFSTWAPMAIAGIGEQRDTLTSRSVAISLRRKLPSETTEKLPHDLHAELLNLRRRIARWAADNAGSIGAMEIEPPACGDDRLQDNFTPLWRIAEAIGGPWPDRVSAAYSVAAQAQDEDAEPAGVMLLRDLAEMFASRDADRLTSADIVSELITMEERPWAEWRHGRPITAQTVAKLMKPFQVKVRVLKLHGSAARVYLRADVEAAAARYTAASRYPVTRQYNQQLTAHSTRNSDEEVTPL